MMTALLGGQGLTMSGGVLYSVMDLKIVLLSAAGCYAGATLLFRGLIRHTAISGELVRVRVELAGRSVTLTALRDTGNTLSDPATNRPVIVADYGAVRAALPVEADPSRPVDSVKRLSAMGVKGARLLPFRSVGTELGLLLAVRSDGVTADGAELGPLLIALSPGPVSDGGGYQSLIGGI